jgi:hypothetical protein
MVKGDTTCDVAGAVQAVVGKMKLKQWFWDAGNSTITLGFIQGPQENVPHFAKRSVPRGLL